LFKFGGHRDVNMSIETARSGLLTRTSRILAEIPALINMMEAEDSESFWLATDLNDFHDTAHLRRLRTCDRDKDSDSVELVMWNMEQECVS
jgi:hypothetical protein